MGTEIGAVFGITFPIYAALALGYFIVWKGWFGSSDMKSFGSYVYRIALPALVFTSVSARDPFEVFQTSYVLPYAIGGVLNIAVTYTLFTLRGTDPMRRALGVMGSTCPNNGFVGYPVMLLAFPEIAGVVLTQNLVLENLILTPICLMLMEYAASGKDQPLAPRMRGILWNVLKMPTMIALILGFAVSFSGLSMPDPFNRFAGMLAASAGAVSLIVIGGSLVGLPMHGNRSLAAQIAASKLLLHPALVSGVAFGLITLGLIDIPSEILAAVILSAAMPMFTSYIVFAQRQGLEGAASLASLAATVSAFVTLNILLWVLV